MTKIEFLQAVQKGRDDWDERLKGIDPSGTEQAPVPGKMSLRDLLYHIAWYEREMVSVCQLHSLVGSPWWNLPTDERNVYIMEEGQGVSLLEAYHQERQVYSALLAQLQTLSDEELEDASFFKEMPPDWKPWEVIASNTYEHYAEHLTDLA
jgi:uncharacterized damage-inducible protein DinB